MEKIIILVLLLLMISLIWQLVIAVLLLIAYLCDGTGIRGGYDGGAQLTAANGEYGKLLDKYVKMELDPQITINDIHDILPYTIGNKYPKTSVHIGQRKLFINELQFLTEHLSDAATPLVVYAGAAPSNKTGFLSDLFPAARFLLVDPNPFDIFGATPKYLSRETLDVKGAKAALKTMDACSDRICIINGIYTMGIAEALAGRPHCFISDIRTNVYDDKKEPDALDVMWNMSQQYNWIKTQEPTMSMLKFRHPFYSEDPAFVAKMVNEEPYKADFDASAQFGIDFRANLAAKTLEYFDGEIFLQPWAGISSTETRLVTDGKTTKTYEDHEAYDNKLHLYNTITRCYAAHANDNADQRLGFDLCNDCAIENVVWKNYIAKSGDRRTVKQLVEKLSKVTYRPLIREGHGKFFTPYTIKH